jgi:hypothetical protein
MEIHHEFCASAGNMLTNIEYICMYVCKIHVKPTKIMLVEKVADVIAKKEMENVSNLEFVTIR